MKKGRVRPLPSYSVDGLSTNPVTALSHVDDVLVVGARNAPGQQGTLGKGGILRLAENEMSGTVKENKIKRKTIRAKGNSRKREFCGSVGST